MADQAQPLDNAGDQLFETPVRPRERGKCASGLREASVLDKTLPQEEFSDDEHDEGTFSDGGGSGGSRAALAAEVEAEVEAHLAASPFLKAALEALARDLRREYQAELGVLRAEVTELRAATRAE